MVKGALTIDAECRNSATAVHFDSGEENAVAPTKRTTAPEVRKLAHSGGKWQSISTHASKAPVPWEPATVTDQRRRRSPPTTGRPASFLAYPFRPQGRPDDPLHLFPLKFYTRAFSSNPTDEL